MGAIETRTFKSGNSVAVRLPKSFGLPAGTAVTMEQVGDTVTVRPAVDVAQEKRKLAELVERLHDIWGDKSRPPFDPEKERVTFPERPGL